MPFHPTCLGRMPVLACLALAFAGACLPGAHRAAEAPVAPAPPPPPPPEPRRLTCVPRPVPSAEEARPALPPAEKAWLMLQVYERPEPSGRDTSLLLRLSTTSMYSCLGYTIPAQLSTTPGELRLELGGVKPPSGPCPAALGPASGEVVLPANERGLFTLRLKQGKQEDQYRLVLEKDRIELSPLRATFSASQTPLVLLRAPEEAIHLQCIFKHWENRCQEHAAAGGPTCETFFADPEIANLEPLKLKPGWYSLGVFNQTTDGCAVRAPQGVKALARYLSEHYRDPSNCLYITFHTSKGGGYSNL
ncbi:hypothetical protein [Archangium sp.]|uniref:hypothetical protein n=1 Tax=Archangium sp. TaxID=1872627 RepID=UPI00286D12AA|nr:hypothetical protein [Archangium sp.]